MPSPLSHRARAGGLAVVPILLAACASWQRQPLDPLDLLAELEAATLTTTAPGEQSDPAPGFHLGIDEAASWAVEFHPELRARRRAREVAAALVVEAGALPDLGLSWSAMDVLAADWTGSTPSTENYISGLGLMWRLPRPDEWPAREERAQARVESERSLLLQAEWQLAGAVRRAYVEHLAAIEEFALGQQLEETIDRSADWFERARDAGTATPLQAELAGIQRARLAQEQLQRQGNVEQSWQRLCALLGLPPTARPPLELDGGSELLDTGLPAVVDDDAPALRLVEQALERRPDVKVLLARYEEAEQEIRLEVARQFPEISIGTGIEVMVGLFRGLQNPAIETARARRAQLGDELRAAVHRVRAEVHEARRSELQARAELEAIEDGLLPRIEQSIDLSGRAFSSGAVSFTEILETQRQVLEARSRHLQARTRLTLDRVALAHALGLARVQTTNER